jgi:DNA-binding GntR family transcriptional regulator
VAQHREIADALERGDLEAAALVVAANFRDSLPGILERIERASAARA